MSLLAASTSNPSVGLHPSPAAISSLGPLVNAAVQCQKFLSAAVILLSVRTYLVASVIGETLLLASQLAGIRLWLVSRFIANTTLSATRRSLWALWNSKRCRRMRRKLEFEFFVLFLGPGGNTLCLLLFWPGWLVLGLASWAFW